MDKPLGERIEGWVPPRFPDAPQLKGQFVRLELLQADAHAAQLFKANSVDDTIWTWLPYGPFASAASYHRWIRDATATDDVRFHAIFNTDSGAWEGVASYLRIQPDAGSIEVGHINFAPALQHTRAATEAMYLMMQWAFEAGYRRYEWKCDALNLASRHAAQRLGLSYEGTFRQAAVIKGRNRDTAWFAATDKDWPALKEAFRVWLSPSNFDADGQQVERLGDLTRLVRVSSDPVLRNR